jgi:23S rRNA pseudouridine2605 synthase
MPAPRKNKSSKNDVPPKNRRTRVGEERPFRKPAGKDGFEGRGKREESDRPFGDKPFKKREFGDKPAFGDKPYRKKEWGDKPSSGDRPFKKKEWGDKSPSSERPFKKKEWGDKSSDSDRPFKKKEWGDKASSSDRPFKKKEWGDKSASSDRPFKKKDWGDKPASGDRPFKKKEWGDKPSSSDKPFKKREWGDKPASSGRPERTPFRDKSSFEDKPKKDWGEKRSFGADKSEERSERIPLSDKPAFGARRSRETSTGRKPFERKPFERKGDAPFEKKSFNKASETKGKDLEKSGARKSFTEKKKSFASPAEGSEQGLIRLNKYISNAGICSRREADKLIETGVISVNGKIVTELGFKVSASDEINFGGQVLRKEKAVYILLNKPKDYITTLDDPEGRKTVLELIHNATKERVYPVGRLDRNTTGLLLLTNDGDLTKKLTHPRYGVKKIYQVTLDKALTKADMQKIADGFELEDGPIKADDISYVGDGKDKNEVGIQLHSGRNRIVRRVFEHLGYDVVKLDRVYFAGLTKKDLPRGRWRMLSALEVSMLKMVPGE